MSDNTEEIETCTYCDEPLALTNTIEAIAHDHGIDTKEYRCVKCKKSFRSEYCRCCGNYTWEDW